MRRNDFPGLPKFWNNWNKIRFRIAKKLIGGLSSAGHMRVSLLFEASLLQPNPAVLTLYTLAKSQRIADFLDALTNERLPLQTKVGALFDIWRKKQ
jgi:hypothetical protein